MSHSRPVLLAAVVVLVAVPLAAAAGATPSPAPAVDNGSVSGTSSSVIVRNYSNTTNYLDIPRESVVNGDHGELSLDVAGAVESDVQRLRSEYSSLAFDAAYSNATGEAARVDRLRAEIERLDTRIRILEERQRLAIEAYNAGELSTRRFVRRLATIDAAARGIEAQFAHLRQRAGIVLPRDLDRKMESLQPELVTLRGPVRPRVTAAMSGQRPATHVYALTSENGVVLSTTDGERLYREAHLPHNRELVGANRFNPSGIASAINRTRQLYPWTYANAGPSVKQFSDTSVYRVILDHSQGRLTTFVDGTTADVFREMQTLQVERLPTETTANTSSGLTVRVNHTYGTGPMNVTVVDSITGEPVDATVVVNGNRLGRTGADGSLWAVAPHRAVRIKVQTENATVRVAFFAD